MKTFRAAAIILARTNYAEADRIITFITPDHGKVKAIVKGVRKQKSKLAGGIELFSVSDISFIPGRGDIDTVVSTRLITHYGHIVKDLDRTNAGYSFIKKLNKATEDAAESTYFDLLNQAFQALDDPAIDLTLVEVWFNAQLLRLAGHTPNLRTDTSDKKLEPNDTYDFDFEKMCFGPGDAFDADNIKFLRLLFSPNQPDALSRIKGSAGQAAVAAPLIQSSLQNFIRL
jgi:DNA repair protein RecO (recombination protein O)